MKVIFLILCLPFVFGQNNSSSQGTTRTTTTESSLKFTHETEYQPEIYEEDVIEPQPAAYQFSYSTGNQGPAQIFREERREPDGTVVGKYGYVDPTGQLRVVEYRATADGFQVSGDTGPPNEQQFQRRTTVKQGTRKQDDSWDDRPWNYNPNYNSPPPPPSPPSSPYEPEAPVSPEERNDNSIQWDDRLRSDLSWNGFDHNKNWNNFEWAPAPYSINPNRASASPSSPLDNSNSNENSNDYGNENDQWGFRSYTVHKRGGQAASSTGQGSSSITFQGNPNRNGINSAFDSPSGNHYDDGTSHIEINSPSGNSNANSNSPSNYGPNDQGDGNDFSLNWRSPSNSAHQNQIKWPSVPSPTTNPLSGSPYTFFMIDHSGDRNSQPYRYQYAY